MYLDIETQEFTQRRSLAQSRDTRLNKYIAACQIDSVLTQDHADREIIVRDGGSTDGSVDVLRELGLGGAIRWISEPDGGQAEAINRGLREATGEIHAYLNSDDVYYPGALRRVAEYFAAHPEALREKLDLIGIAS